MEPIETSIVENRSARLYGGRVPYFYIQAGALASIPGFFISLITPGPDSLANLLGMVGFIGSFSLCIMGFRGRWEFEGFERFFGKIKLFFGSKTLDTSKAIRMQKGETGEIYSRDAEIFIFRLTEDSARVLAADYRSLLKQIPKGCHIQLTRQAIETENTRKTGHKIHDVNLYASIVVPYSAGQVTSWRSQALSTFARRGEKVDFDDYIEITKNVLTTNTKEYDWDIDKGAFSPVTILEKQALAHTGDITNRALVLSLAQIPEKIGEDFQKFYNLQNSLPGTITVKFESQGRYSELKDFVKFRFRKNEGIEDKVIKNRANLAMTVSAVIHGKPDQLEMLMDEMDKRVEISDAEMPKWARDNEYIKDSVQNTIPGFHITFDRRRQKILDMDEALRYIPYPMPIGVKNGMFPVRTNFNTRYIFDLFVKRPLLVLGDMGDGKTALMSYLILQFLKLKEPIASFSMETGGGFSFLRQSLSDINFVLEQKEGKWQALDFHPLEALLFFKDSGLAAAINWLTRIAGEEHITDDMSSLFKDALFQVKHRETYRMKDFYEILEPAVLKVWNAKEVSGDHSSRVVLKNIKEFCALADSKYGSIFDPDKTKDINFDNVRHIYVSQLESSDEEPELLSAHFGLGMSFFKAIHRRFMKYGDKPSKCLVSIDECGNLRQYKAITFADIMYFNSQGRKQGKYLTMGTQWPTDMVPDGSEKPYAVLQTFSHFLFPNAINDPALLLKMMRKENSGEDESITKDYYATVEQVQAKRLRTSGTENPEYPWGYITVDKKFRILNFDFERDELWSISSDHAAGALRAMVEKRRQSDFWETSRLLAKYGPKSPPTEKLPASEDIENMFKEMFKNE